MKLTSIIGKGTGKLGGSVFAVSEGRQIVREYQPKVSNPRTEKQQEQRIRFSGLVLLAREFAPSLMFLGRKAGVTERNEFVRRNTGNDSILIDLTNQPNFVMPDFTGLFLTSGVAPATVRATGLTNNKLAVEGTCPLGHDIVKVDVYERVVGTSPQALGNLEHLVLNGTNVVKATDGQFAGNVNVRAAADAELVIVAVAMKSNENSEYFAGVGYDGFEQGSAFSVIMNKKEMAAAISEVSAAGFATYTVQ